jgi:hypothetical protein
MEMHIGGQLLRHDEFATLQPIETQLQPAAKAADPMSDDDCRPSVCDTCAMSAWA